MALPYKWDFFIRILYKNDISLKIGPVIVKEPTRPFLDLIYWPTTELNLTLTAL